MDLFLNLGIYGACIMYIGKMALKNNDKITYFKNIKILNLIMSYIQSDILANINIKYGKYILIAGAVGTIFYNIIGLLMVVVMCGLLFIYLWNVIYKGFKFCMSR